LPRSTPKLPCLANRRLNLRSTSSLTLISIAGLIGIVGWTPAAMADCPNAAAAGQTIICTGMDTDGMTSTYDNTTVNILAGANVTRNAGRVIYLSGADNSSITLSGDAVVFGDDDVIVLDGVDSLIELTDQARVVAGTNDHGIDAIADRNTILMRGSSSVTLAGTGGTGINHDSDQGFVELTDNASVQSTGANSFGITLQGEDAEIFLHGNARVELGGAGSTGIQLLDEDADLFLNDNAQVNMSGANSVGIEVGDDDAFIVIDDRASVNATGAGSDAILLTGDQNSLTIRPDAAVRAAGANSHAIRFSGTNNIAFNEGTVEAEDVAVLGGANRDTFANAGTVRSSGVLAIDLAGGNDDLSLGPGSNIIGNVDGGAGDDYLTLVGFGREDSTFLNFERLRVVSGPPFLTNFSLSGTSTFSTDITIFSGRLLVDGTITSPDTEVQIDGSLGGNGRLISDVASAGVIAPGSSIGTLTIQGDLLQTGGSILEVEYGDGGLDRLNVTGTVTLMNSPKLQLESLGGTAGINGIILHADTAIVGSFASPDYKGNGAATVIQSANDIRLLGLDGTPLVASNDAALQAGIAFMNVVSALQIDHRSTCLDGSCSVDGGRSAWVQGFARFDHQDAGDGNDAYHDRIAGSALGGDIAIADGWSLGGSLGYADTLAKLSDGGAKADIDGAFAALYATYEYERFFITGMAGGGLQQFDLTRDVSTDGGTDTARADTEGWQAGGGLLAGMKLDFPGGWRLTPNAGVLYQHQSVDGYREKGAGDGNVSIGRQTSDAVRFQAGLDVARTLPFEDFTLIPYLQLGAMGQINFGDDVPGSFSNGSDFTIALRDGEQGAVLLGAGMDIELMNGVTANIGYRAEHAQETDHALRAGISVKW